MAFNLIFFKFQIIFREIIWAKTRGFQFWPAKVLSVTGTEARVSYFSYNGDPQIVTFSNAREFRTGKEIKSKFYLVLFFLRTLYLFIGVRDLPHLYSKII